MSRKAKVEGLGGVLFDGKAAVIGWFGIPVPPSAAIVLGSLAKESLIYELELLAAIVALRLWGKETTEDLHVCYGDNESCFMNMINFYLLKGQSEFLHVKQKQLPCF